MPYSDRALRALAQRDADRVVALLAAGGVAAAAGRPAVTSEHTDDPHVHAPPAVVADWVARVGDGRDVLHVEFQGYDDPALLERLCKYHLGLLLRYEDCRVHTVAVWLIRPPARQRRTHLSYRGVRIRVRSLVLRELSAAKLVVDPLTACFAAGAAANDLSDAAVCTAVAEQLIAANVGAHVWAVAAVLAATVGRYDAMVSAMRAAKVEPVIFEELVQFGEERGRAQGRLQLAMTLADILGSRGFELTDEQRARVEGETSLEQLRRWCQRALAAHSVDEVLQA